MKEMQFTEVDKSVLAALSKEKLEIILEMLKSEIADIKLTAQNRKKAAKELNTDAKTARGWQTVADIFKHLDTVELARKYPEAAAAILNMVIALITLIYGIYKKKPIFFGKKEKGEANGNGGLMIPQNIAAKIVEFSGMLTPEHIVHTIAEGQAKRAKADSSAPEAAPNA